MYFYNLDGICLTFDFSCATQQQVKNDRKRINFAKCSNKMRVYLNTPNFETSSLAGSLESWMHNVWSWWFISLCIGGWCNYSSVSSSNGGSQTIVCQWNQQHKTICEIKNSECEWTSFSFIGIFCKLDCIFIGIMTWIESWERRFITGVFRLKSCLIPNGLTPMWWLMHTNITETNRRVYTFRRLL